MRHIRGRLPPTADPPGEGLHGHPWPAQSRIHGQADRFHVPLCADIRGHIYLPS